MRRFLYLVTKKCRIYAACGVSQTPNWNRIRKDFPEVFESRAKLERLVGYSILKDGNGTPIYLDELEPFRGNMNTEVFPDCSIMCYLAEK